MAHDTQPTPDALNHLAWRVDCEGDLEWSRDLNAFGPDEFWILGGPSAVCGEATVVPADAHAALVECVRKAEVYDRIAEIVLANDSDWLSPGEGSQLYHDIAAEFYGAD